MCFSERIVAEKAQEAAFVKARPGIAAGSDQKGAGYQKAAAIRKRRESGLGRNQMDSQLGGLGGIGRSRY
jgi:hypothetical protein